MSSLRDQVVRAFLWQGGGQLAGQAISWISTLLVIRLLSSDDYGLLAMANVLMGFFFLIADLGFGAAAIQAREIKEQALKQLYGIVVMFNVAGFILTLVFAPAFAAYFEEPRLWQIISVLAVNFLLLGAYVIPQSAIVREMDFRTKAGIDFVGTAASAGVALALAWSGFGVWALVFSSLTLHGTKALAYNIVRPTRFSPSFSPREVLPLLQFGALITLDRLLFFLYGQVDVLIGGRVLGTETIGLYAVALSLAVIPMEKIVPVLTQVSFAAFARIQDDRERVQRNVRRGLRLVGFACFPAFVGMAAVAPDLIPLVLSDRWQNLVVPFQILCLSLPLKALAAILPPALFGVGQARVNVVNMSIILVLMTIAIAIGVRWGVLGLCLAWVTGYPLAFLWTSRRALSALGLGLKALFAESVFATLASLSMGAVVLASRPLIAGPEATLAALVLSIAIGAATYGAFVLVFQRSLVTEIRGLLRRE